MTIEEIIKEAFSRGWNASHECATDFDYDCALNGFLSEVETELKKFRIGAVSGSSPYSIYEEELNKMKQLPQTQTSLMKQCEILRIFANKLGLYDAADFLRNDL